MANHPRRALSNARKKGSGYENDTGYILLPCFYGIRFWIWPELLVAPRVRRALGTRMSKYYDFRKLIIRGTE